LFFAVVDLLSRNNDSSTSGKLVGIGVACRAGCESLLLLLALELEGLGLGTTCLGLGGNLGLCNLLGLLTVNGFDQHTLILEHITLAFHVQGVVQVLVDFLGVTVLLQETTEHTQAAHPDNSLGHARVLATDALTSASVSALALGSEHLTLASTRVNLCGLLDHQTILGELADIQACQEGLGKSCTLCGICVRVDWCGRRHNLAGKHPPWTGIKALRCTIVCNT